jgi:hypothetical protein
MLPLRTVNNCLGSSQGKTMQAGKPHDHGKARGQSSTTVCLDPSAGEIPTDLPTHHAQAIMEVLATTEIASAQAPMRTTAVRPALTSPGSMTRGLYVVSSIFATVSSMTVTPMTAAMSSHGHNAEGRRLRTASTHHNR